MASASLDSEEEISSINVTPLVDVVLVLLVIFMITAPTLYQQALQVQLPQTKSGEGQSKSTLQVVIDRDGTLTMEGKKYTLLEFELHVKKTHPNSCVILADKKVEHGVVIQIVDTLKTLGVQKFSFGIEKR